MPVQATSIIDLAQLNPTKYFYLIIEHFLQARTVRWFARCAARGSGLRYNDGAWGRPGFDVGCKAVQGIPRTGYLVNTSRKNLTANDNSYALAA
jgi:hypothetical protein